MVTAPNGTPAPGLRERKKTATRAALSQAALRLAVERGWENVRVEDIAAAAGVSPRTFNNYFPSKEAAVLATQAERAERIVEALRARPEQEPLWDALTGAFIDTFRDGGPDPSALQRIRLAMDHTQLAAAQLRFEAEAAETLAAEIAHRTGTDPERDLYPRLAATLAITTSRLAFEHWVASVSTVPALDAVRQALDRVRVMP
ncbi:TetR family transcriptional regulator [Streptomyces sp. NPDC001250]|uniref:TetR family transcriptional regulator n=1 Tax=unclassified Streptomyces TaxID=2593676 RepID=UPI003330E610